jgi:hypothetical protein
MLDSYSLLKLLHLLLFVYWLGGDIGVFHSAQYVRNASLTRDARATALRILAWIDLIPRYCLVLMLPVGYTLAHEIGAVTISAAGLAVLWLIAIAWLALVYAIHRWQGTRTGQILRNFDLGWRIVLTAGLIWDAVQGFRGKGHIEVPFVAAKFAIFAFLIFCGIMIRLRGAPLGPALRELLARGSTPKIEETITTAFARTRPFVLAIWAGLVVAAYIGIAKPTFGLSI